MTATTFSMQVYSNNQVVVSMMDGNVTPYPIPSYLSTPQEFTLFAELGNFTPSTITIANGVAQGVSQFTLSDIIPGAGVAGVVQCTCTPGTGPLSAVPAQNFLISIDPDDTTITLMCAPACTRPILRDEIRSMISITPPIDNIYGALEGEVPVAQAWPSNSLLNRCISDAITKINRTCEFYNNIALTQAVTATTNYGPQWFTLQGLGGSANQNVVNKILRVSWLPTGGTIAYVLRPQSWQADDNQQFWKFNSMYPSVPYWYIMNAYSIGLLPGAGQSGTLEIWAGTGIVNFCSDTDILNQLPIDYQPVIKYLAATMALMSNPSLKDAKDQIQYYGKLGEDGLGEIKRWASNISQLQQNGLTFKSRRVQRLV